MPNTKISALTSASTPLAGTEVLPIVQSSTTTQVTVANLTSGRAVNTGQLSVVAAQSTDSQVRIRNSTTRAAANQYGIRFADSSNETNAFIYAEQKSSGNNSSELVFGTNNGTGGALLTSGVELMRGTGTGDIKIVTGNISISTTAKGITTGSAIPLGFGTNGSTTQAILNTSGNVGIGTTTPAQKLTVNGSIAVISDFYRVYNGATVSTYIGGGTGITGGVAADTAIRNDTGDILFATSGAAEKIRITSAGNLNNALGNVSFATSGKGVTTSSAISLGFGTNGSTTGMTLDTSNNLNVLGSYTANSVAVPTISSTSTLTNKRVTPRVSTTTSSATPTINTDNVDVYGLTAQAVDITSFSTNLSGTPTDGQLLRIYIVGTAARAITWGASFEASTTALPTTTVTTNRLDVGFVWNAATSKWRCLASA
jgi:hypothetical protein